MDNQLGFLQAAPAEGRRKGKFLEMECIPSSSSSSLFLLRVLLASDGTLRTASLLLFLTDRTLLAVLGHVEIVN